MSAMGKPASPVTVYVQAAEATIKAAAGALVWSTPDAQGVLTHVAAADPWLMASTRLAYEREAAHLNTASGEGLRGFADLQAMYRTIESPFEVAALPWTVAPDWSARIRLAVSQPSYPGPYDRVASAARSAMEDALHACRQWSQEQLNIDRIAYWAEQASASANWVWRFHTA